MGLTHLNSNYFEELINIGISLSKEKNINVLLENILSQARKISNSDGGTLYIVDKEFTKLEFAILQTKSKDIFFGGTKSPVPDTIYPVKLFDPKTNEPNHKNVSAVCALKDKTIKIDDAYKNKEYDFEGTKGFDIKHDYHSKCFLNVPMKNHKNNVIGVIQLLNPMQNGKIIKYSKEIIKVIESLTSQASIALTNQLLIEEQKTLFRSFIKLVVDALDKKDPVTGGHCNRVPLLTMMIAEYINNDNTKYKNDRFTDDEMDEIFVAGWLHDFGKVATPDHIMNKSTKLQGLYDKIDQIKLRFEILKRDIEINFYKNKLSDLDIDKEQLDSQIKKVNEDFKFLEVSNIGGEFMSEELQNRVYDIAKQKIELDNEQCTILNDKEVDFLTIKRGTLSNEDREIMENHVSLSYELLDKLPYPDHLKQVPFYAGCHHEKLNGGGYPNGYSGDQLPLQARIIAIADVFEGLTAPDRPYKEPYKLSKSLNILKFMVDDGEIDRDLFNLLITKKLYLKYANEHLNSDQIDSIDEEKLLS